MAATVEVKGLGRLVSSLRRAGIDLADMKDANQRAGEIVAAAGRQAAPRRTGALAASIRPARQARKAVVRAGGGRIRYASFQEYGTKRNQARRYLHGSAEATQSEWIAAYNADLARILAKITGE